MTPNQYCQDKASASGSSFYYSFLFLPPDKRRAQVMKMLDAVGMAELAHKRPDQLSGGQKQRVAVARALVSEPQLVLADEPTANLDSATGEAIIDLMLEINRRQHTTFIFSTHDPRVMAHAHRVVRLEDGRVAGGSGIISLAEQPA